MLPSVRFFLFFLGFALSLFSESSLSHVQAYSTLKTISRRDPSTYRPTLSSASWIWAADSRRTAITAAGNVAFLRQFTAPIGQGAASAVVSMTAVDNFYLWVNGQPIGSSSPEPDQWKTAQVLTATLNSTAPNTFSVLVVNSANSAAPQPGLLAAILILFSDGTNTTIVSDSNWLASTNIPVDFPTPVDTSSFSATAVGAPYGSGSWGQSVTVPAPGPTSLNLSASTWIWSTSDAQTVASAGLVGFRRTIFTPPGKSAQSATIILTVDNYFWLYLNGVFVGAPPTTSTWLTWQTAQRFNVTLNPMVNTLTLQARNDFPSSAGAQNSAGFIAAIQISYADGSSDFVPTNSSWLNSPSDYTDLPTFMNTSDDLLNNSIELGTFGMAPWTGVSIADALDAASVPQPPFSSASSPSIPSSPNTSPSVGPSPRPHAVPMATILGSILGGVALVATSVIALHSRCRRQRWSFDTVRVLARPSDALLSSSECAASVPIAVNAAASSAYHAVESEFSEDNLEPPPSYTVFNPTVGAVDGPESQR